MLKFIRALCEKNCIILKLDFELFKILRGVQQKYLTLLFGFNLLTNNLQKNVEKI